MESNARLAHAAHHTHTIAPPHHPQIQRCITHMPSLLILDDLDVVCPAAAKDGSEPPPGSTTARGSAAWLAGVMDELRVLRLPGTRGGGWMGVEGW